MAPITQTDTTGIIPGWKPQDKSDLVQEIVTVNGAFGILVIITLLIRLWTRLAISPRNLRLDDCLKHGLGIHTWNMEPELVVPHLLALTKHLRVDAILYTASLTLAKLSVIVLYLRVLPIRWFRRVLQAIASISFIVFFITVFVVLFQCRPMKANWDFRVKRKSCANTQAFFYFAAAMTILTDCIMCTLPLPLIWKLGMDKRKKVAVSVLFGVGFVSCIASAIRMSYISYLARVDVPYAVAKLLIWSVLEVNLIIICATVPTIKAFFVHTFPRAFSDYNGSTRVRFASLFPRRESILSRRQRRSEKHQIPSIPSSDFSVPPVPSAKLEAHNPQLSEKQASMSDGSKASTCMHETVIEIPEKAHDIPGRPKRSPTNGTEFSLNMPIQLI